MRERFSSAGVGSLVAKLAVSVVLLGVLGLVLGWWQWPSTTESNTPSFTLATESQVDATVTQEVNPSTVAPALGVTVGEACDVPGFLGLARSGNPVLCSETALDGTPLPGPQWRETARGNDLSPQLSKTQAEAVAAAKELSTVLVTSSDPAVLIFIEETAAAMRLASESDVSPGESFSNLVNGVMNANSLTSEDAVGVTVGVLAGVIVLKGADDPVALYSASAVEWLRSELAG